MSKSDMSDLIERSEVLKQLRLNHKDVVYIDKNECARRIEAIPPAEVVPKGSDEASLAYAEGWKNGEEAARSRSPKGEWIARIPSEKGLGVVYECPYCKYEVDCVPTNYCPNCGADMRGDKNGNQI